MKYLVPFLLPLAFFIAGVLTISDYGMNEDSPFHFLRGQYYLQKFLTGKVDFKSSGRLSPVFFVPGQRISLYKLSASEELFAPIRPFEIQMKALAKEGKRVSFYKHNAWAGDYWDFTSHPPVSDILMALSNRIFYEKLGILGDIEAYHLYIVFVASLAIFFVFLFAKKAFGQAAGIFAALALAAFPFYFAESHFSIKDVVQASFFSASLVSFYFWVTGKHIGWFAIFVFSTFLALGTKWNIAFLPIILIPWFLFIRRKDKGIWKFFSLGRMILFGVLALIVPFVLLTASWPFLWGDTLTKLVDIFKFYTGVYSINPLIDRPLPFSLPLGFNATPLMRAIFLAPPVLLLLFVIGLFAIVSRKIKTKFGEEWLVLLWLLVPILRVSRQWVDTTGSIRQFIEYLPAFVIIAGIGAGYLITQIYVFNLKVFKVLSFEFLFYVFTIALLVLPVWRLHPNQNVYFNFLVGGLRGAQKLGLYSWQGTYDNVYRQGVSWFNNNSPKEAKLAYLDGTMLGISPLWLRRDIHFGSFFSGFEQKSEYIISLVYPSPPAVFGYNYLERFLTPIYEIRVDNVPLLKIWHNDPTRLKPEFRKQVLLEGTFKLNKSTLKGKKIWELKIGEGRKITRIILAVPKGCSGKEGVWSILYSAKETFIDPQKLILPTGEVEVDFWGDPVDTIRFWDINGSSCLYQAEVENLYVLP